MFSAPSIRLPKDGVASYSIAVFQVFFNLKDVAGYFLFLQLKGDGSIPASRIFPVCFFLFFRLCQAPAPLTNDILYELEEACFE